MAATPHSVTSLDDVEELLQSSMRSRKKGEEVPSCVLQANAALNAAAKLKSMVDAGAVRLVNPEMLDSKLRAKAALEEAMKEMIEQSFLSQQMLAMDEDIAKLKNRLQTYAAIYPESMEGEAIVSEVQSQRVSWAISLKVLEANKELLQDHASRAEEAFHGLLADTLQRPSFLGAGDADYKFITHALQL